MTEPMAADDLCEHHYETRILGGRPISVRACVFCRTPDWADLDEQAAELYRWGWQEGRDGKAARETLSAYDKPRPSLTSDPFSYEERQRTGRNAGLCTHPGGYDGECLCPPSCACCPVAAATPQTALQRLHRLRGQLAVEQAKAVRADQHPRPDLDHLRVTPHNGIAVGLEIALFFADHQLREAGEEARTTVNNRLASEDAAGGDPEHVCKPGASLYYCPASGETESDCHGGFDVCCDRPDLHQPAHACGNCEGEDPDTCLNNPRRTTPDNPVASNDTADNPLREQIQAAVEDEIYEYRERTMFWEEGGVTTEIARLATRGAMEAVEREMGQLRADAEAWRHKAIRRALAISKLRGTIDACTDLADEQVTDRTGWGDGYRAAIGDLREVLREFGHIEASAEQAATETETTSTTAPPR